MTRTIRTKTLVRMLRSVRKSGSRFSVLVGGTRRFAKSRQDARRRAYKHARMLRARASDRA